jgi:hypothetical protein
MLAAIRQTFARGVLALPAAMRPQQLVNPDSTEFSGRPLDLRC